MKWIAFSNTWMLAAFTAVALPVAIHFLTRARPKKVSFPPFRFLQEACAGQQALHRLRKWILLTIRTLLVFFLVLLFARPFLRPDGAANQESSRKRVVLIVDASLSMRAAQSGVALFDRAKAEAAGILRQLEPDQEGAVILAGASPRLVLPAMSRNIPALHEGLVNARPTYERADVRSAIAKAVELFGGAPGTLFIFSDFQRSNWENAGELPAGLQCRLRQVAQSSVPNLALTAIRLEPAEPVTGEPVEVICRVFNCTSLPREETVRLKLGEFTQEHRAHVPAFGWADCAFNLTFAHEGPVTGRAWIDSDDLAEDNVRYIAARVRKAIQVLLVSDSDKSDTRSAAFFIARALVPSEDAAPGMKLIQRHSQDIDRGILESADVFLLTAPAVLSGEATENIGRRVHEGARCLIVLDGGSPAALIPAGIVPPFRILQAVDSASGESVLPAGLRLFRDADQEDLLTTRFYRHLRAEVLPDRAGEVAFLYADGSPALTLGAFGDGTAAFINMPVTPDAGDFAGSPMFPATLHEVMRWLRRGAERESVTPGKSWVLETMARGEGTVEVTDSSGARINAQEIASGRVSRLALPPALQPGIFSARQGSEIIGAECVNVDLRESDTRPMPLENVQAAQGASVTIARGDQEMALSKAKPLWPHMAAMVGVFIALEMLLLIAWRVPRPEDARMKGAHP